MDPEGTPRTHTIQNTHLQSSCRHRTFQCTQRAKHRNPQKDHHNERKVIPAKHPESHIPSPEGELKDILDRPWPSTGLPGVHMILTGHFPVGGIFLAKLSFVF